MQPKLRFKGFTDEWQEKKLGEIGKVVCCKRIYKEQTFEVGDIPFYKIGTFGKTADSYISKEIFNEYKEKFYYPTFGSVLISASGTLGRIILYRGEDAYFQDSNIVWLNNDEIKVLNIYLFFYYQIVKWNGAEGSTIKRLYNSTIEKTKINFPTKKEQSKIADLLSTVDDLIDKQSATIQAYERLKKFLLQKLFANGEQKQPKLRFKGFTDEWQEKKLEDIAEVKMGYPFKNIEFSKSGIPVITISNINKFIYDDQDFKYSDLINNNILIGIKDDILIALSGATTGKSGQIKKGKYYINQRIARIRGYNHINSYIFNWLNSDLLKKQLIKLLIAGAQPNLSISDLNKLNIKISCSEEQEKIADLLSTVDDLIELNRKKLTAYQNMKQYFLQNMFC